MSTLPVAQGRGAQTLPSMADGLELPRFSVVVETSTSQADGTIQLADSLRALRAQDYPDARLQIVVVVYGSTAAFGPTLDAFGITERLAVSDGTGYYEAKRRGLERCDGQIVGFVDGDNLVPPDWAAAITRPFLQRPDVVAVLGRHRFRRATLSRFWDMLWWDRSFEREGPIDKLSAANNIAFRREVLEAAWYPDPARFRGAWERAMTDALRRRGALWFTPAAQLTHDYTPGIRTHVQRAYARGFSMLAVRNAYPRGPEARLGRIRWLVPWAVFPALLAKDVRRILDRSSRAGYAGLAAVKVPALLALLVPTEVVTLAGMLRTLNRRGHVEPP